MKAIHTWVMVMTIFCAVAFGILIMMSSCTHGQPVESPSGQADTATENDPGQAATDGSDPKDCQSEGTESGSEEETDSEEQSASLAQTESESESESATERATEAVTETESETEPETEPPRNTLRFLKNTDGTYCVAGIGNCTDSCIVIPAYYNGKKVTSIAASAFYGCKTVYAVQIPETVRQIGDLAFAGCTNLMCISVDSGNRSYRDIDGVLYSADGSTLILYPPARGGSVARIGQQVKCIAAMAFYNCRYLSSVEYEGSAAQWERIVICSGNYSLHAASLVTSSGAVR